MLCTKCKEKIRPVAIFDIDGSLGDYHGHFLGFAEMWLGWNKGNNPPFHGWRGYNGSEKFSDWFCSKYSVDLTTFREIKLAYRQGAQKRSMPLYANMERVVASARQRGAEIWIATTRPYLSLSGIDADTRFWLDRHKIPYDYLLYDEDKYAIIADRVDADRVAFVLDDEVSNLFRATQFWRASACVLRRTRYNAGVGVWRGPIARDGGEAMNILRSNIQEWRSRNG
jgi:hypothetical protein